MRLKFALLAFLVLIGSCDSVRAQTFTIHTALIPPYILEAQNGSGHGLILEIMTGALKQAGLSYTIENDIPWRRAQAEAIDLPNSLISPFARTPGREPDWTWVSILVDEKMVVYTSKNATFPASTRDLKQIKSLGILAGGAPESVAKELELDSVVQSVTNEAQNAKKLESGRLDAWMSQGMMASWGIRYSGIDPSTIKRAFDVRDLPLWVATSKKTSPESVEKLKKAFEAFRASPAYRDIIARY